MFVYCVEALRLSEGGAYNRIEAARVARSFPVLLEMLEQGLLTLATLRLLAPHLTAQNHERLLEDASGKSKREVEALLARVFPKPDVAPSIRKLPTTRPEPAALDLMAVSSDPPSGLGNGDAQGELVAHPNVETTAAAVVARTDLRRPPPLMTALSPDRYQVKFTASAATCEKLKRAQDLLRHAVPNGDPAEIVDRALTALLEKLERRKFAATGHPRRSPGVRAGSRAIPAVVKRSVMVRDQGCCAFVARDGHRCSQRAFLEFHHVVPYARGGPATVGNIQLRCRAHNAYEAYLCFGKSRSANSSRDELGQRTV